MRNQLRQAFALHNGPEISDLSDSLDSRDREECLWTRPARRRFTRALMVCCNAGSTVGATAHSDDVVGMYNWTYNISVALQLGDVRSMALSVNPVDGVLVATSQVAPNIT
jgi:hypothetical protein